MIWSDKTKEAVALLFQDCRHKYIQSGLRFVKPLQTDYDEAQAALAAVAESDEWKAKDAEIAEQCRIIGASGSRELKLLGEIERLKRQVSVLREACENEGHAAIGVDKHGVCAICQALAAADKIGEK